MLLLPFIGMQAAASSALAKLESMQAILIRRLSTAATHMRLNVFANDTRGHIVLMAVYDDLGQGASGAAVQNLNIMIGADEASGVDLPVTEKA